MSARRVVVDRSHERPVQVDLGAARFDDGVVRRVVGPGEVVRPEREPGGLGAGLVVREVRIDERTPIGRLADGEPLPRPRNLRPVDQALMVGDVDPRQRTHRLGRRRRWTGSARITGCTGPPAPPPPRPERWRAAPRAMRPGRSSSAFPGDPRELDNPPPPTGTAQGIERSCRRRPSTRGRCATRGRFSGRAAIRARYALFHAVRPVHRVR